MYWVVIDFTRNSSGSSKASDKNLDPLLVTVGYGKNCSGWCWNDHWIGLSLMWRFALSGS